MGSRIRSVGVTLDRGILRRGSIDLVVNSAKESLKKGDLDPGDIGVLVNCGVYRDHNISEPSIASFIQRKIRANPLYKNGKRTFSFDVMNGGCGLLSSINVVDTIIRSGEVDIGMVVTSDSNPNPRYTEGFNFKPAAFSIILESGPEEEGFTDFRMDTYSRYVDDFSGALTFKEGEGHTLLGKKKGKNLLTIDQSEDYTAHCIECALETSGSFLESLDMKWNDIDLVIPSQYPPDFVSGFAEEADIDRKRMIDLSNEMGPFHTAGPGIALDRAMSKGIFQRSKNTLFLFVGSGLTAGCILYRNAA
jgi:3-oxoacyl-[acyl-carrier-protein] synthase-3